MQKMGLNEIRERYLKFFEGKDHLRINSFPLVPQNDPSLLLINSGMAPLKPYFTGVQEPPKKRVTTCQKCIRTPDIENVGKTARHGTFFEMLGNFSFGDYFKKEAIAWAWEFVTRVMKMPEDKLWITIYEDDNEAFEIWNKEVGIPPEKIVRMGKADNFWEHGTGPCGPCSEIYFDRGNENGCGKPECKVGCECDRFVEFWNLVFTQFNKDEAGNYSNLKSTNIDTGMGLERIACVMQGVDNLFEVDTIRNILDYICSLAKVEYGKDNIKDISIRVITDHIRSTVMMVCDGVIPQNEGRGYVLRRLLRRAARHGRLLGISNQFLHDVARIVINESKDAYPDLFEKADYIKKVIKIEEEKFEETVDKGLEILNSYIADIKNSGKEVLNGEQAFILHATYGFPLDLTREIVSENGLSVDEKGFKEKMDEEKKLARDAYLKNKGNAAWDKGGLKFDKFSETKFVGYTKASSQTVILGIVKGDCFVKSAQEGDEVSIILGETPFYAESGGQIGDTGVIKTQNGSIKIDDCKKTHDGKFIHSGIIQSGLIEEGANAFAQIDETRRLEIARNHTTTHLLQKALKNTLGSHVNQAGSLVDGDRLRFDFNHFTAMTAEEIAKVEKEVNSVILQNLTVVSQEMKIDDAKKLGATALFGEKYGDTVRVISAGDYSIELCGGTHLTNTAQAGFVKVLSESGVASGVRRIEALTGEAAINYMNEREKILLSAASLLKTIPGEILNKIDSVYEELKAGQKEVEKLRSKLVNSNMDEVLQGAIELNGAKVVTARFDSLDLDALRNTSDIIREKLGSGVVVLASSYDEKVNFIVAVTKDLVEKKFNAGSIVREVAKIAGGGGGGRPDMAQAGGKDIGKINEALKAVENIIKQQVK
jgi:alanyl-tRNA synthetase